MQFFAGLKNGVSGRVVVPGADFCKKYPVWRFGEGAGIHGCEQGGTFNRTVKTPSGKGECTADGFAGMFEFWDVIKQAAVFSRRARTAPLSIQKLTSHAPTSETGSDNCIAYLPFCRESYQPGKSKAAKQTPGNDPDL